MVETSVAMNSHGGADDRSVEEYEAEVEAAEFAMVKSKVAKLVFSMMYSKTLTIFDHFNHTLQNQIAKGHRSESMRNHNDYCNRSENHSESLQDIFGKCSSFSPRTEKCGSCRKDETGWCKLLAAKSKRASMLHVLEVQHMKEQRAKGHEYFG